jgi:hypothetical protein
MNFFLANRRQLHCPLSQSVARITGMNLIQPAGGHMGDKKKAKWGCRKAVN